MSAPPLTPLQQSARYAATLRLLGREVTLHEAGDGPPVLSLRRRFGPLPVHYLPRADLSGPRAAVLHRLPRSAARLLIPETGPGPCGGWPLLTPQHVAELSLPPGGGKAALWRGMRGKWRNRLRRALDGPLTVRQGTLDPARHAPLLALEEAQRRARGYRNYPPAFLAAWAQANPHHTLLTEARLEGESVAFMLFLLHGPVASYVTGWSGSQGRQHHAHTRLMWEGMRTLFARGILRLDLGAVDSEGGSALARFKLGCGARARSLGPTCLLPPGFRVSP